MSDKNDSIQVGGPEQISADAVRLMGDIMSAQIGATHRVMDQLADAGWQAAAEWAQNYRMLLLAIYEHNDSLRLERELNFHPAAPRQDTIDHYLRMGHAETVTQN